MDETFAVISREKMERSAKRARKLKPKAMVRVLDLDRREFIVESANSPDRTYLVAFDVVYIGQGREIRARCHLVNPDTLEPIEPCKGFEHAGHCYHIAVAAGVNVGIRHARTQVAQWAA